MYILTLCVLGKIQKSLKMFAVIRTWKKNSSNKLLRAQNYPDVHVEYM